MKTTKKMNAVEAIAIETMVFSGRILVVWEEDVDFGKVIRASGNATRMFETITASIEEMVTEERMVEVDVTSKKTVNWLPVRS